MFLAPAGVQEVTLCVCVSVCPSVCDIMHSSWNLQRSLSSLSAVSQRSLSGLSAVSQVDSKREDMGKSTMFSENIINFICCTSNKIPASSIDKLSLKRLDLIDPRSSFDFFPFIEWGSLPSGYTHTSSAITGSSEIIITCKSLRVAVVSVPFSVWRCIFCKFWFHQSQKF